MNEMEVGEPIYFGRWAYDYELGFNVCCRVETCVIVNHVDALVARKLERDESSLSYKFD